MSPAWAYIKVLDGSVAVFSSGVVDKGTLVFQQHLDAVNAPGSDGSSQETKEQRYCDAGSRNPPALPYGNPCDHMTMKL